MIAGRGGRCRQESGDGVPNGGESELREQSVEPPRHPAESAIVPQARDPGNGEPRLGRIELPGVDVERAGHAATLAAAQPGPYDAVGEQPEVRPPCGGQLEPAPAQRGRGNLSQPTG